MNYEKAWHFLLCHQPMPADEHLTPAIIAEYDLELTQNGDVQ